MMVFGFSFLVFIYCISIIYMWMGWERIPMLNDNEATPPVTVLIPIRNEAVTIKNLLKSLLNQTYAGEVEVIIIDDHSEDESNKIVKSFVAHNINFKLIELEEKLGKKAAIASGVSQARTDIILTIDGDCLAPPTWVEAMVKTFGEHTQMVSGSVKFKEEPSLFNQLQRIEFTSLIGSGAALIGWGKPLMANGANLGFRKTAFLEVGGFAGNEETASGDDVFLLHKIAAKFPKSVAFVKQEEAIIETLAQPSLKLFMQQRIRWASKWKAYTDLFTKTTAVLIFLLSLSMIVFPFITNFNRPSLFIWANLMIIKSLFDFYFIRQVAEFLKIKIGFIPFVLLQVLYPFYVVITAMVSFKKRYYWKGRTVQ